MEAFLRIEWLFHCSGQVAHLVGQLVCQPCLKPAQHLKGGPIVAGVLAWWALLEEVLLRCPLRLKGGPVVTGVLAWWALLEEVLVRCPLSCKEISCFYDMFTHRSLLRRSVGLLCQHRPLFSVSYLLVTASS